MITISTLTKPELERLLPVFLEQCRDFGFNDWTADHFLADLPDKWQLSVFIQSGDQPAGFSINSRKEDALHIHYLFVFREYRRFLLGNQLVAHCEKLAVKNNLRRLTLKCNFENYKAVNFYFNNGFRIGGILPDKKLYLMDKEII
jgi:ribosomal protein S18 acetylase RimI-like enzyme